MRVERERFAFSAEVWEYQGSAAWYFVDLPESDADDIDQMFGSRAKGFGSLRVEATVGATTWRTSIFPDTKRGTYVLPLKKAVRTAEQLADGTLARVELRVLVD